jgi:hypothetical protein
MKGYKIYQANAPTKQAGVAMLITDKVNFKSILVRRDKTGHFILIKGALHQEEITIVNLYVPSVCAPKFIKNTLLDLTQIDPNTVVVEYFNTPLSPKDRSSREKINKEILELNDTTDQMDLSNVYRYLQTSATAQYAFFSAVHGILSKIDRILGHKASLNKYKKIENIRK